MAEKKYKYEAKIKQTQMVGDVKLSPEGGTLSEREIRIVKKDAYGASLLEKSLLVIEEKPAKEAADTPRAAANTGKRSDRPEDHAGWKPE